MAIIENKDFGIRWLDGQLVAVCDIAKQKLVFFVAVA